MFRVVSKMRLLTKPIRNLMWEKGDVHTRVKKLGKELDIVQSELDKNPNSENLRYEESVYLKVFNEAVLDEESLLKQKSKISWLKEGDANTGYFHKVVKGRQNRARIHSVRDNNDIVHEVKEVPQAFLKHYQAFLG